MRVIETTEPIRLKGRYLITDPCYVYGDSDWSKFCDLLFANREPITLLEIDGKLVAAMSTAYGDGGYPVFNPKTKTYAGSFGVDAGLFAFIPWCDDKPAFYGTVVELDGILTYQNGNAYINGQIVVDTNGEVDFEDEDEA